MQPMGRARIRSCSISTKNKTMKLKKLFIVLSVSLFAFIFSFTLISYDNTDFEISKNLDIFATLFRELNIYYVDETDPGDLMNKGIEKMLQSLDPYTTYYPESKIEDFKLMTTGQYGGIGALIRKSGEYVVISEPYENFPAQKADLKAGDIIVEIDGKNTRNKSTGDISELLKGQPNTKLSLTIQRPGEKKEIKKELTREKIQIESVPYYAMITDDIGYIRLTSFTNKASSDVKSAFKDLKNKHHMKKLIFDLRGNPGGLLIEAVHISNIFVKRGQEIVNTKGKLEQWNKTYKAMHDAIDTDIPLVILVNRSSASASEIVSGAIQDLDRGVIIGERTFGKGLVQTSRQLSYNAKLKVTTAKYYIPSGRCIQALDYSHRNEDGSVGKIPDSLISEFQTKNGRIVKDGGGILPDIKVKTNNPSKVTIALIRQNLIFDYVTEYCINHDSVALPGDIAFSDNEYEDFLKFLENKEFDYETRSEEKLNELIQTAEKEKYYDVAETEFNDLKKKIAHDKDKDLQLFKDEIKRYITEEISSRYYYQKGRLETILKTDSELDTAISVLNDTLRYNNILTGKEN